MYLEWGMYFTNMNIYFNITTISFYKISLVIYYIRGTGAEYFQHTFINKQLNIEFIEYDLNIHIELNSFFLIFTGCYMKGYKPEVTNPQHTKVET
jgi:hypothetical protein